MTPLDPELKLLKKNLLEMLDLVTSQLHKCRGGILKFNPDLVEKINEDERNINSQELNIEKQCENILALYSPVATDLRFVLSSLKITHDLERIGDYANRLGKFLKQNLKKDHKSIIEKYNLDTMLEVNVSMLKDMAEAIKKGDSELAMKATKLDQNINEYNKKALKITEELIKEHSDKAKVILRLFYLTRNMERSGDLTKNIGKEIVFYIEAQVLKHKKDSSRK